MNNSQNDSISNRGKWNFDEKYNYEKTRQSFHQGPTVHKSFLNLPNNFLSIDKIKTLIWDGKSVTDPKNSSRDRPMSHIQEFKNTDVPSRSEKENGSFFDKMNNRTPSINSLSDNSLNKTDGAIYQGHIQEYSQLNVPFQLEEKDISSEEHISNTWDNFATIHPTLHEENRNRVT